jgi:hypothetical protein
MQTRTEVILNLFADSWIETERSFEKLINHPGFECLKPLLQFISILKAKGENNHFRIGTTILRQYQLIISRSVGDRLRKDQKHITIEAYENRFEVTLRDGDKIYREYILEDLSDERLTKLLKTLKDTLID